MTKLHETIKSKIIIGIGGSVTNVIDILIQYPDLKTAQREFKKIKADKKIAVQIKLGDKEVIMTHKEFFKAVGLIK